MAGLVTDHPNAEASASPWRGSRALFLTFAVLEAVLAFALAWYRLGSKSLWYDEGVSAIVARATPRELLDIALEREPNMVGYHALLQLWRVVGDSESALRSLSLLALAGAVLTLAFVGRRLHGSAAGLAAGLVLAVAPFMQRYAQEARSYALTAFLVVLATYCFVALVDGSSRHDERFAVPGFALATAFACYAHLFAVFVVLAQVVSLALLPAARVPWRRLAVSFGLLTAMLIPFAIFVLFGPDRIGWIPKPALGRLHVVPRSLTGGDVLMASLTPFVLMALWRSVALARHRRRSIVLWRQGLGPIWAAVPFVTAFAVSVSVKPMFIERYLIVCVPAVALVVGAEIARVRVRALAIGALAVIIGVSSSKVIQAAEFPSWEDWRGAIGFVLQHGDPADGIVTCPPEARPPAEYYVLRAPAGQRPVPLSPPGAWDTGLRDQAAPRRRFTSPGGPDRVWVLTRRFETCEDDVAGLLIDGGRARTLARDFGRVRLERFER
jgi:mannosyltransferase